jgi:hypothetical protein
MKKYDVVIKPTLPELIELVNEAIEHGYYPKGGILHVNGAFIQTIYLRDDEKFVAKQEPKDAFVLQNIQTKKYLQSYLVKPEDAKFCDAENEAIAFMNELYARICIQMIGSTEEEYTVVKTKR